MSKETLFLYQLYSVFYKYGLKSVNISKESLKYFLPYLKSMLEEEKIKELAPLFVMNEDGLYERYLEIVSSFDPLFATREGNKVNILLNDEMANLFFDSDVEYIGEKVAVLRKIKEKEKVVYENN